MFSSSSDAFLGVDCTLPLRHVAVRVYGPNEDGLEMIQAGVGEHEGGVVQGDGRGGMDLQIIILKLITVPSKMNCRVLHSKTWQFILLVHIPIKRVV